MKSRIFRPLVAFAIVITATSFSLAQTPDLGPRFILFSLASVFICANLRLKFLLVRLF